jgi:lipoprotein NlpI
MMGNQAEAGVELQKYHERTRDPWYRSISEILLAEKTELSLREKAGAYPENLLTLYMHLGLWAEGLGDREKAIRYYKQALESYMDNRIEYAFAIVRVNQLKKQS